MDMVNENDYIKISGYLNTGMGLQIGGGAKLHKNNIIWLSLDPTADLIYDIDKAGKPDIDFDFVVFPMSLGSFDNPLFTLKKISKSYIKEGGYIIILEKINGDNKHKWFPQEMEGFLYLFSDILQIDNKIGDDKSYAYILRKKVIK